MKAQPEFQIQAAVCKYLRAKYPNVGFVSSAEGALNLTMGQAMRNKSVQCPGFAVPDIVIYAKRGGFGALFIELKAKTIYRKDGVTLLANKHVENQLRSIRKLRADGFKAEFACSYEEAIAQIEAYFKWGL